MDECMHLTATRGVVEKRKRADLSTGKGEIIKFFLFWIMREAESKAAGTNPDDQYFQRSGDIFFPDIRHN